MLIIALFLLFYTTFCSANASFLIVSDIHYGEQVQGGQHQDTGPLLLHNTLKKIEALSQHVDFILNLGDLPAHAIWLARTKGAYEQAVFHGLFQADTARKPMFYIPGNNDSLGGNYQPFFSEGLSPLSFANEWDGACVFCDELVIDKSHMLHDGYYSSYVMPQNKNVVLIALNTAPFVYIPWLASAYPNQESDADAELSWLEQQLKQHHSKQLLIAMHAPPGVNYKGDENWHKKTLDRFVALLNQYADHYTEITLLSGHTHMDELRQLKLARGITVYDISTPSVSRVHYNNSGIKIISLNANWAVSNYTTYYTSDWMHWGDESYRAIGGSAAIFLQCTTNNSLAYCLNSLSAKEVCNALEQGHFYGVKSELVPQNTCPTTYTIFDKQ